MNSSLPNQSDFSIFGSANAPVRIGNLLAAFCALFLFPAMARAHGGWELQVRRLDPSRPNPVVDGVCDPAEYIGATKYSIIYSDRYPGADPAIVQAVNTASDLYICVSGLPYRPDLQPATFSVTIDKYHDGGKMPYPDDFRLDIDKTGALAAYRGSGLGGWFRDDDGVPGWTAARTVCCGEFKFTWTVEFRIPIALIGSAIAPTGIHLRHSDVRFTGDDYGWPPVGAKSIPNTWGDIAWIFPGDSKVELDVATLTDGLEYDLTGGVTYNLIAGKDALLRAQLFTAGELRKITSAECRFRMVTVAGYGPLQTVAADTPPMPTLNPGPYGYFKGATPVNCWIPGTMIETPGIYHFDLAVTLEGTTTPQIIPVGNYGFLSTGDLRLLLAPITLPPEHPRYRAWDSALSAEVFSGLYEAHRVWPLRNSVGFVLKSGAPTAGSHGLRVSFLGIDSCPSGLDSDAGKAWNICDGNKQKAVNLALQRYNAEAKKANLADGMQRDLFDKGDVLYATTSSGGGWCCTANVAEGGMDNKPGGLQGQIVAHEIAHSVGEVKRTSPHSAPTDPAHSSTGLIPLKTGLPMVHMRLKSDFSAPLATMNPGWAWTGLDPSARGIHEGWEWNDLRTILTTLGSFAPTAVSPLLAQNGPRLVVAGLIDQDNISRVFSARYDDLDLSVSPLAPNGPYALVLRDANGNEVGRFPFALDGHAGSDGDDHPFSVGGNPQPAPVPSFHLTVPLPNAAASATIEKQNATLYSIAFSQQPPTVGNVIAIPNPQIPGRVFVSWTAVDPDSPQLQYNVLFKATSNDVPLMVASGLTISGYSLSTDFAPASSDATVIIEASDGYHTARAVSSPFSISPRAPLVHIDSPAAGATLVAGQRITLVGLGYDWTDGFLDGPALLWTSEQNTLLGRGSKADVRLSAGQHVITLTAIGSSGQTAQTSVQVVILADSDGDGLPDIYEAQFQCMSPNIADSDQDPDGDGLTNLEEYRLGTNPCNPDSDNDGIVDGDEARLGSNPLDPQSRLQADLLFLDRDHLELVGCPELDTITLFVQVADPQINWTAVPTADWMVLSGGGPGDQDLIVHADCQQLPEGIYRGAVILTTDSGQRRTLDVSLTIPPPLQLNAQSTGQQVQITLWAANGKRYQIEAADNLSAPIRWQPVGDAMVGSGDFANVVLPVTPNSPQRFYRVLRLLNDDFINRAPLVGLPVIITAANVGVTSEPGEPNHANGGGSKSLWWSWTAPNSGPVTISTTGSDFDTLLAVYTGNLVSRLSLVAQDDDSGGNRTSRVNFNAQAGTTYQIAVDGYLGASGNIRLTFSSP